MPRLVAVDLGGTHIRAASFEPGDPRPARRHKTDTPAQQGPRAVVERIIEVIEHIAGPPFGNLRLGVGAPGPLDPQTGVVYSMPNLPGWEGFPLRDRLGEHFGCPVFLGNDANLAALGEWRYGAGQRVDNMIYLTISTGIGGGVIAHGRLLTGAHGLAGELGHMPVERDGPLCGCGQRGHLEAVASGTAIAGRAASLIAEGRASALRHIVDGGRAPTAEDVDRAAQQGDALAVELLREAGEVIGRHLASLAHAFNPQRFVIGGGVSRAGRLLFEPMERALRDHIMHPAFLEDLALVPAALGDDAGLVGAMVLASET